MLGWPSLLLWLESKSGIYWALFMCLLAILAFLGCWLLQHPVWVICGQNKTQGSLPCCSSVQRSLTGLPSSVHLSECSHVCFIWNIQSFLTVFSKRHRKKYVCVLSFPEPEVNIFDFNILCVTRMSFLQRFFVAWHYCDFIHLEACLGMFFITTISLHISLRNFHFTIKIFLICNVHPIAFLLQTCFLEGITSTATKPNFNESTKVVYDYSTWAKDEMLLIISFIDFFQMHTTRAWLFS